jgi:hypothetical protein
MTLPEYREGDLVYPGRFLAEVLDVNQMEVVAKVYESDRSNLNVGQTAEVQLDAEPHAAFPAKVKSIAGVASRNDFGPNAIGRFEVVFSLSSRSDEFRPGTSAEILVRGNQLKDQLYLPAQCLFEKDGKQVVYVKQGKDFGATPVKVKFRTESSIALENLAEGTEVALVNPEEVKKPEKARGASPVGVGQ